MNVKLHLIKIGAQEKYNTSNLVPSMAIVIIVFIYYIIIQYWIFNLKIMNTELSFNTLNYIYKSDDHFEKLLYLHPLIAQNY